MMGRGRSINTQAGLWGRSQRTVMFPGRVGGWGKATPQKWFPGWPMLYGLRERHVATGEIRTWLGSKSFTWLWPWGHSCCPSSLAGGSRDSVLAQALSETAKHLAGRPLGWHRSNVRSSPAPSLGRRSYCCTQQSHHPSRHVTATLLPTASCG